MGTLQEELSGLGTSRHERCGEPLFMWLRIFMGCILETRGRRHAFLQEGKAAVCSLSGLEAIRQWF